LTGWTFAHKRYELPVNSDAPSTATVEGGRLQIVTFDQNYGDATMRSPVKYDLRNGGELRVDLDDNGAGNPLVGYATVLLSAGPQDAALSNGADEPDYGPSPTEGVQLQLRDNCREGHAPPIVVTYPTQVTQRGNCPIRGIGARTVVIDIDSVTVLDAVGQTRVAYNVAVPPVGFVTLGVHNHASVKYENKPSVTGWFDNLSYPTGGGTPPASTTTTTTQPASTTSTSSTSSTTTTTTPPPSGVQFFEDFSTNQSGRFDWRLQTTVEPPQGSFLGEHDPACHGPTTFRTVVQPSLQWGTSYTNVDVSNSQLIWWCAPSGDPASGHMMTGLDTGSIATLSFIPKQTFTNVTKVCWDQNMNNLGEGKWINVFVIPAAQYSGDPAYGAASADKNTPGAIPQNPPAGTVDFTWLRGSIQANKWNTGGYVGTMDVWMSNERGMATESASRFTICLDSGANRVTIERPIGVTDTYALGTQFPTGAARVIFQDASYNPTKHGGGEQSLTWHWDNITIS
jgi:hypothetical protein